jgi:urease accessory protein
VRTATQIIPAGQWGAETAFARVLLDSEERQRRRVVLATEKGMKFLLDLPHPKKLRDGDGLLLDDGSIVRVVAQDEPLVEITAASARDLARLAWHLGNRHAAVEVVGEALRIRRDHVLETLLTQLGARLTMLEAPFEPEGGAYDRSHSHGP